MQHNREHKWKNFKGDLNV